MAVVEQAERYNGYIVLPGQDSVFEMRTGRRGYRWDGSLLDVVYHDAGINTVSFTNAETALAVLRQNGNVRKHNRPRIGDAAFLADGYLGIVVGILDKHHCSVRGGWRLTPDGKRAVTLRRTHNTIDVVAFADPVLPVRQRVAIPLLAPEDRNEIANLLANHPAVGTFVSPEDFSRAYARWQRYCGYGPDRATGVVDSKSLDRLCREERGRP